MGVYLDGWLEELVIALSAVLLVIYVRFQWGYQYWKKKGVQYVEPSVPFGNMGKSILGLENYGNLLRDLYEKAKGKRFVGLYSILHPVLLVRDPELIRQILIKDFGSFHERGLYLDYEEPLYRQLFFLPSSEWRHRRVKLTPAFTSGKLKGMFQTIQQCGRELAEVATEFASRGSSVEVREMVARYTTDVIVSVGFGVESDCQRNPDAVFRGWGRRVFNPDLKSSFGFRLNFISPLLADLLRIKGGFTEVSSYFRKMIADNVEYREKNNVTKKDFIDLLMQLKNKGFVEGDKMENGKNTEKTYFALEDLAAESFGFYAAGFETSSTTISCSLYELALHEDIQNELQQEIDSVLMRHDGNITYDAITEMSYLDKAVSETLRKYPPLPFLNRDCTEPYKIPDSDVVVDKGTGIVISLFGLHYDPEHFPDPERYDPERFSEEMKAKRHPYVYLPFGDGLHSCIGMRLGLLQTKVGLVNILSKCSVRLTEKTARHITYNTRSILLLPTEGIELRFVKRS
ncbi:cytochrome P450 6k1-like [Schistocerca cancellata]|uniref:cytochrome P450 6k1-like n=1 Tax=Schistocerca cancellata TaxID=274614 RepID=UPI002118D7C8|nr:cytochrome P450 6k1-like [Schistocerca cancellata]